MRMPLKTFVVKAVLVTITLPFAVSCTPEQVARFVAMGPTPLTAENMTPEQRAVLRTVSTWKTRQLHPFLTCVRRHESDRGPHPHVNGYRAQNPQSTASGAYQFLDSTWRNVSVRAGYAGYARAVHAPWYVQDAVALWAHESVPGDPWAGTGC
jgi:muramidase (phage lysozyme)